MSDFPSVTGVRLIRALRKLGFESQCEVNEELLLRDPRFKERIAQARSSLRDRRGISIEELQEKYGTEPPADSSAE